MRKIREITAEEENFRLEPLHGGIFKAIRRDPVQPEPIGTIVLIPFKIAGYDQDCDGSLMARMYHVGLDESFSGWLVDSIGLYPVTGLVVTSEELKALAKGE